MGIHMSNMLMSIYEIIIWGQASEVAVHYVNLLSTERKKNLL